MKKKVLIVAAFAVVLVGVVVLILATRAGAGEKIKIGRILPLTGPAASCGKSEQRGTLLAVEEVNAAGGIEGRGLEIVFEDSRCSAKDGLIAMKKLVQVDKVPAVLGATVSEITLAISPIANERKVLLLAPLSSASAITEAGPFVFRVTPSETLQSRILADWIVSDGHKKIAVLHLDNAWGKGVVAEFERAVAGLGGTVICKETCKAGGKDFRAQLTKIRDAKPAALFCATTAQEGATILKQIKALGLAMRVYGADGWTPDELLAGAKGAASGVMYVHSIKFIGPEYQAFAGAFGAKYADEPDANAAAAYDAVKILAACMSKVAKAGLSLTGENIRNEMKKVKGYQGATGTTTFDENGDSVARKFGKMMMRVGTHANPYYSVSRVPPKGKTDQGEKEKESGKEKGSGTAP